MYKRICFLFGFISAIVPVFCRAEIIINEIMYDASGTDTNHEWIELFNNGTTPVDITGWKLFENDSNHGITPITASVVAPGGYAIIADNANQFKIDYPNVGVPIFDTTMSLSNTGETLALKNSTLTAVDQIAYQSSLGATGNGNSLNRTDTTFVEARATPGVVNSSLSDAISVDTQSNTLDDQNKKEEIPSTTIRAEIISDIGAGTVHIEMVLVPKILWTDGTVISAGRVYWNFGDGEILLLDKVEPVHHTYTRPGKYVVVLEYGRNYYAIEPEATSRLVVSVMSSPITFSREASSLVIKNTGSSEIDMSQWTIVSAEKTISLPRGTILLGGSELVIPFAVSSSSRVALRYPNGTIFSEIALPVVAVTKQKISRQIGPPATIAQAAVVDTIATVSDAVENNTPTTKIRTAKILYASIGFLILVITATLLTIKIRRNKKPAEDTLSVDDIQIIDSEEE